MEVIKMFYIAKAEEMNESTERGRHLNWQETTYIQKQVYFWSLYLVIPEVNCLHHNDSLYVRALHHCT